MLARAFPVNPKSAKVALSPDLPRVRHVSKEPDKKPWPKKPAGSAPRTPATDAHFAKLRRAEREARERRLGPLPTVDEERDGQLRLFGLHAVEAALRNPKRKVIRLVLTENAERRLIESLGPLIQDARLADAVQRIERAAPRDLDKILGAETVHQGAMLATEPLPEPSFAELADGAHGRPLLVLDQITDPHNAGAILRSAAVFGTAGVVMTRRHAPPLNGVLAKSASGALELVPIALVANLARALEELKAAGFLIAGLEGSAEDAIEDFDWSQPTALVMGAEGKGLRDLTGKICDRLLRITTDGPIASLNVSNAAAIALHTAAMARRKG